MKGIPVTSPERLVAYGTAVVHSRYAGGAFQTECDHIVCIRHRVPFFIQNFYRHKSQIIASGLQDNPVRGQFQAGRCPGG